MKRAGLITLGLVLLPIGLVLLNGTLLWEILKAPGKSFTFLADEFLSGFRQAKAADRIRRGS